MCKYPLFFVCNFRGPKTLPIPPSRMLMSILSGNHCVNGPWFTTVFMELLAIAEFFE